MGSIKHGLCIFTDGKIHKAFDFTVSAQLIDFNGIAVPGKEIYNFEHTFCDRSGLITEQDIQRTCRLDTFCFSYQNVVIEHLACILHQYQRNHQRQTFRNGTDDDHDCQRNGFHNVFYDRLDTHCKICGNTACLHDKVSQIQYSDHDRTDVTKGGNLFCEFGKLDFQRRIRLIFLHLFRHLTHHGLQANFAYVQNTFTVKYNGSAEQGMCIHKGITCDIICQLKILCCRRFFTFFRLSVQSGVVHTQCTVDQHTVCRDLVSGLQQDLISDYNIIDIDHGDHAVPVDFALVFFRIVFQLTVLGIACDTGLCRYGCHDQYRDDRSEWLVNLRVSKEEHHDHQCCDCQQDLDHRIIERLFELIPERSRFGIRDLVGTKFASGLFDLFVCQTIILHLFVSCFVFLLISREKLYESLHLRYSLSHIAPCHTGTLLFLESCCHLTDAAVPCSLSDGTEFPLTVVAVDLTEDHRRHSGVVLCQVVL